MTFARFLSPFTHGALHDAGMVIAASEPTGGLVGRATDIIDKIGLLGVGFLIALESIFPPIPSEVILLLSGFEVDQGSFTFFGALVASTIGSVVGAFVLYMIGRLVGEDRLERLLATFGKPLGFKRSDIDKADAWFDKYGEWVVFFGRLVPIVRSLVSIPAGANRMNAARFLMFTTIGSLIWNAIWIGLGVGLGDQWEKAEKYSSYLEYATVAAGVAILGWLIVKKRQRVKAGLDAE
jgi:membrane protein DedA with SNARE-associated domain